MLYTSLLKTTYQNHDYYGLQNIRSLGIDWQNRGKVIDFLKNLAKKNGAILLTKKYNGDSREKIKFKCIKCSKDKSLIHPAHSEFEIKLCSLRQRFVSPIKNMELKKGKSFHPKCGKFIISLLSYEDVLKYIKRYEKTAKIICNKKEFVADRYKEYMFECRNKGHSPLIWSKQLREISKMREMNSIGCKSCGQKNSDRTIDSYRKK